MPYGSIQQVMPQMMPSMPLQYPMFPQAAQVAMPQMMQPPMMMMPPQQQQQFVPAIFQQSQQNMQSFAFGRAPNQLQQAPLASAMGFPPQSISHGTEDDDSYSSWSSSSDDIVRCIIVLL